jgi:mannose-6-phosphate isomerase-like protein (cupin superfamily)
VVDAKPVALDLPALIEKNYIGRGAGRTMSLACATGGTANLIQLNEPLADRVHAEADEFLYVVAGEGMLRLQGREERLRAGMFTLVPRGLTHTLLAAGRSPLVLLSMRAGAPCGE